MMIRPAVPADLPAILPVYRAAREYMRTSGNPNQWGDNKPAPELLAADIEQHQLYVITGDDGAIHAAFVFFIGIEPTYAEIFDGAWLDDGSYGCIHRVASDGTLRGVFTAITDFAKNRAASVRIDTHHDNHTMQHVLEKNGFIRCGIIYLKNGDPRIAFQFMHK